MSSRQLCKPLSNAARPRAPHAFEDKVLGIAQAFIDYFMTVDGTGIAEKV